MIIDSHGHYGSCFIFDHHVDEQELLGTMDANGVDCSLLMPFPGTHETAKVHDQIHELSQKYPGRIYGMICINPHSEKYSYMQEVQRCVKMGFRAIKIHPLGHACPVHTKDANKVFEAAAEFNLPVIVHTGLGIPFTLPSVVIPRAKQYPDMKIILAHAGAYIYSNEAELIAKEYTNVYLETSWVGAPHRIKSFITNCPGRVMFGSDLLDNVESELAKIRSIKAISAEEMALCLGGTAKALFKL